MPMLRPTWRSVGRAAEEIIIIMLLRLLLNRSRRRGIINDAKHPGAEPQASGGEDRSYSSARMRQPDAMRDAANHGCFEPGMASATEWVRIAGTVLAATG